MIIPKLVFNNASKLPDTIAHLKHWSLFGRLAIVDITPAQIELAESISQAIGGSVDLIVGLAEPNDPDAIKLLNAGASHILLPHGDSTVLDNVPEDRILRSQSDDQPDQAISPGTLVIASPPSADRIAELEMARIDALVDVHHLENSPQWIADVFQKVLVTDRADGLWPTLIVDPLGTALGLAYSNDDSLLDALTHHRGTYWSRSRGELWVKGATSGATQNLLRIDLDCDRDCLRFTVTQDPPGFCHRETHTCFGPQRTIQSVIQRLAERITSSDENSFTKKLVNDPGMLEAKLLEEARELSEAKDPDHIAFEAADVLYFSLVKMIGSGIGLDQVHSELARRMNRVVRRKNKLES